MAVNNEGVLPASPKVILSRTFNDILWMAFVAGWAGNPNASSTEDWTPEYLEEERQEMIDEYMNFRRALAGA